MELERLKPGMGRVIFPREVEPPPQDRRAVAKRRVLGREQTVTPSELRE
jgi:hypothetical protein